MNQKPRKVMSKFLSIIEEGERYGQEEEWIRFLEPNGPSIRALTSQKTLRRRNRLLSVANLATT
ncbi:hypothetical protein D5086_027575, partial [Populus alba]